MVRPKKGTIEFILSSAKNCETINKQTHRKAKETLEFELTKSRETFQFNPLISIE